MSPVDVLKAAADLELTLRINGEKLRVLPAAPLPGFCEHPQDLQRASPLPAPVALRYGVSEALEETVFFCADEPTHAALIKAGAEKWSIYTRDELQILCEQNRIAPFSDAELRKVHEIKRTFSGRITS